ncbi:LPXTG cell wall anchor domain-containing protein [Staphylococcus sp. Marseille-Q1834]|uniref:LPXTG cell wall anchor domain-containing protein n=1 Tax=Staphylococcus sp. Marseille-Q1834 TaxID=2866594 RepID=UPI001CF85C6E|nr:LPXTG cell wall anchor domain-containing protein [Staphylococcus sp. Marseille-Q1834]
MNNKFKLGTFALTTTLLTGVSTHTTYAATNDAATDSTTTQSQQTTQGERPYGGIPPQGMTNEQYAELEQNVPNPNSVSQQQYQLALNDATQDIADKYSTTITVPEGSFKPNAVRDNNGHALPLTKDGNFYQTNVDENGVNHGGSEMLNNQTENQSQQTNHAQQQTTKEHKQALPNTGVKETSILATTAIGALILAVGVFFTFKRKNSSH